MAQLRRRKEIPFGLAYNCIQTLSLTKICMAERSVRQRIFRIQLSHFMVKKKKDYFENGKQTKHQLGSRHDMKKEKKKTLLRISYLWTRKQKQTALSAAGHCREYQVHTLPHSLDAYIGSWSDNQLRGRLMLQAWALQHEPHARSLITSYKRRHFFFSREVVPLRYAETDIMDEWKEFPIGN